MYKKEIDDESFTSSECIWEVHRQIDPERVGHQGRRPDEKPPKKAGVEGQSRPRNGQPYRLTGESSMGGGGGVRVRIILEGLYEKRKTWKNKRTFELPILVQALEDSIEISNPAHRANSTPVGLS